MADLRVMGDIDGKVLNTIPGVIELKISRNL